MEPSKLTLGVPAIAGRDFQFVTYNADSTIASTLMSIQQDGNVGIGTGSPTASLHVTGTALDGTPNTSGIQAGVSSNYAGLELTGTSGSYIDFQNDTGGTDYDGRIILTGNDSLEISGAKLELASDPCGEYTNDCTDALTCSVSCPANTWVTGGGIRCDSAEEDAEESRPNGEGWYIERDQVGSGIFRVYAICCF